jgi:hypothetical protein
MYCQSPILEFMAGVPVHRGPDVEVATVEDLIKVEKVGDELGVVEELRRTEEPSIVTSTFVLDKTGELDREFVEVRDEL